MHIDETEIRKLAKLAQLQLKNDELKDYTEQFNRILKHLESLREASGKKSEAGLPGFLWDQEMTTPLREDKVQTSLPIAEVLQNAPESHSTYFTVPKVVES